MTLSTLAPAAAHKDAQPLNARPNIWRLQRHERVRLDQPRDVLYWTGMWGLTDQELADAVAAVGPMAADVAAHLGEELVL